MYRHPPAAYQATNSLTGQHGILLKKTGSFLNSNVEDYLRQQAGSRQPITIADIACGNAVWTFDAASRYPGARVFGYDISPGQFPPTWARPGNVELDILDLFSDEMPSELHSKFDVVHIRLVRNVVPGVNAQKMDMVFENILKILKPKGFLQWEECVYPYFYVHDPKSAEPLTPTNSQDMTSYFSLIDQALGGHMHLWKTWDWRQAMLQAGFIQAEATKAPVRREMLCHESGYVLWVSQEFIDTARKRADDGKSKVLDMAQAELDKLVVDGCMLSLMVQTYAGRKKSL